MQQLLEPIKTDSLKEVFVQKFEELILSGKLSIGQRLPSERELALQLGVSRPVVHEGLVDLAAKGLITMKPRWGAVVNDYRREGSLAMLNSLVKHHNGELDSRLWESLVEMRLLFEVETGRRAAAQRTQEQMAALRETLAAEEQCDPADAAGMAELDFRLHLELAVASGNMVYPLLLNSFKEVYTSFTRRFFTDPANVGRVTGFHRRLCDAVERRDQDEAADIMKEMLQQGQEGLAAMLLADQ